MGGQLTIDLLWLPVLFKQAAGCAKHGVALVIVPSLSLADLPVGLDWAIRNAEQHIRDGAERIAHEGGHRIPRGVGEGSPVFAGPEAARDTSVRLSHIGDCERKGRGRGERGAKRERSTYSSSFSKSIRPSRTKTAAPSAER